MDPGFQRARTAEHKEQRAEALLGAARKLASSNGVRAVTLTAIANSAGVHVSGVRRYFESREDIFLRLAAEEWADWVDAVEADLRDGRELVDVVADTLAARPLFCDLLGHVQVSFEREVTLDSVWDFKLKTVAQADRLARLCGQALPGLAEPGARNLVSAIVALAAVEFVPTLRALVRTFVAGLLGPVG